MNTITIVNYKVPSLTGEKVHHVKINNLDNYCEEDSWYTYVKLTEIADVAMKESIKNLLGEDVSHKVLVLRKDGKVVLDIFALQFNRSVILPSDKVEVKAIEIVVDDTDKNLKELLYDYDCHCEGFNSTVSEIEGICPECGCPTKNGNALSGCSYSPVACDTCGWKACDGSC